MVAGSCSGGTTCTQVPDYATCGGQLNDPSCVLVRLAVLCVNDKRALKFLTMPLARLSTGRELLFGLEACKLVVAGGRMPLAAANQNGQFAVERKACAQFG